MDQVTTAAADSDRIDLRRSVEVDYWCRVFHASISELRRAVQHVGPQVSAVHHYLRQHPPRDD
jgi:hypothetical protein